MVKKKCGIYCLQHSYTPSPNCLHIPPVKSLLKLSFFQSPCHWFLIFILDYVFPFIFIKSLISLSNHIYHHRNKKNLTCLRHILEYVQFWQISIPYCTSDKRYVFLTIVGYNRGGIRVHTYQRWYSTHCHSSAMDWLDIRYSACWLNCNIWHNAPRMNPPTTWPPHHHHRPAM